MTERPLPRLAELSDTVDAGFQNLGEKLEQFCELLGDDNTLHLYFIDVARAFGAAYLGHSYLNQCLRAARDGRPAPAPNDDQADALAALADLEQHALSATDA